jgi:hypothetical protein
MAVILFVRVKSDLSEEELEKRVVQRRDRFKEIPGLHQKLYGRNPETGDVCGIYIFNDHASLDAFRETELAKTIPTAYEATEVRREVYDLLYPLYTDRRPIEM